MQFRNLSKTNKGFEFVYYGFDKTIKKAFLKKEDNKIKNFSLKTIYKDLNDIVIINYNADALTEGELRVHVLSKDSIYQSSSIDPSDTLIFKKMYADENSWINEDGNNSKTILLKKINSTTIILNQTEVVETASGMPESRGYIPSNNNYGYCHTNLYFIRDNKIIKKYTLYTDYFNLKPIEYTTIYENSEELSILLDTKYNILLSFNDSGILTYKTAEAPQQYIFKLPVTKKYYFEYAKEKYYYFNDPASNKLLIKKI